MAESLKELLLANTNELFNRAEQNLRNLSPDTARRELIALAEDSDPNVRCYSILMATVLFRDLAEQLAVQLLSDTVSSVRWHACEILHNIKSYIAADQVLGLVMNDPSPIVRNRAAIAIGRLGNRGMLPLLRQAVIRENGVDHEGSPIKNRIQDAIARLERV
jgi:HEAT repeat protein